MSIIGMVARNPTPKPSGTSAGSAGRRSGIRLAADDVASAPMNSPTVSAGAIRTPVLGIVGQFAKHPQGVLGPTQRLGGAFGRPRGRPHRTRHRRGRLLRHRGRPNPHRPARLGQTHGRRQSADAGTDHDDLLRTATSPRQQAVPSGWGACWPFWPPSSPLRMPRVPCTPGGGVLAGGVASGSQLPGLAARCLERFVCRIDLHYLRLLAHGVVDEGAVGIAHPLPIAGAVADRPRRAVGARRDVGPHCVCAVFVDGRLRCRCR